jgi:hypothetical protein
VDSSECVIDPCIAHKATDAECSSLDGCIVKAVGASTLCVSGGCGDISESVSCEINGKCIFLKNKCMYDTCKGLSEDDCIDNALCYVEKDKNYCVFDLCNEGSDLNDGGVVCSTLTDCGYEVSDNACKVATSKFSIISVGSTQGVV